MKIAVLFNKIEIYIGSSLQFLFLDEPVQFSQVHGLDGVVLRLNFFRLRANVVSACLPL